MSDSQREGSEVEDRLVEIFSESEIDPDYYPWASEGDRWAELVFCLLDENSTPDSRVTRMAVHELARFDVLNVNGLATIEEDSDMGTGFDETTVLVHRILQLYGFPEEEIERAVAEVSDVARMVQREYDGHVQRFLRRYGQEMRDEFVSEINGGALGEQERNNAVTRWLQNAASMPLSVEHDAVRAFCQEEGVDIVELYQAADELQWNMAFVDDMLERYMYDNEPLGGAGDESTE